MCFVQPCSHFLQRATWLRGELDSGTKLDVHLMWGKRNRSLHTTEASANHPYHQGSKAALKSRLLGLGLRRGLLGFCKAPCQ